jgi:glutamyl-tRNA synthetase
MKRLTEVVALLRFLFTDDVSPSERAADLVTRSPDGYLAAAAERLAAVDPWTAEPIRDALDELSHRFELNRTKGWQPIRAAVTGSHVSPPLPESLELLGREQTVARVRAASAQRSP